LGKGHLEDQKGDGKISFLMYILGKKFEKMGGGWNWLRTVSQRWALVLALLNLWVLLPESQ
jgi:hypothetical protein